MKRDEEMKLATAVIHAGEIEDPYGAQMPPVYRTSTYHFKGGIKDFAKAAVIKEDGKYSGYVYSRGSNPTVELFERRIAAMHNGVDAIAFASGSAAIAGVLFSLLTAGDQAIYAKVLYTSTLYFFHHRLPKFNIDTVEVDPTDLAAVEAAITPKTKLIYVETPSNPTMDITDLRGIAALGKKYGVLTVCDNTYSSAYNTRPLDLGIDVVLESATKYINGHGDGLGGIVSSKNEKLIADIRRDGLLYLGGIMAPDVAYLMIRGLKTFTLRVKGHNENAQALAEFLEKHPKVEKVFYPGLKSFEAHDLAMSQSVGGGGMMQLLIKGGVKGLEVFSKSLKLASFAVSLGDADTLVVASTRYPGYGYGMPGSGEVDDPRFFVIRISVGLEDIEDLKKDFDQALNKIEE
ncbi:MAG: PLP-dependent aspartate aminotransferase family protein [Erysipelotrichaceae bacterium]|nr:PLP-dependent aspartate aminotransferase family protein [Erysipelotrichaceae bacterium]